MIASQRAVRIPTLPAGGGWPAAPARLAAVLNHGETPPWAIPAGRRARPGSIQPRPPI
jgi:hypothetical protein